MTMRTTGKPVRMHHFHIAVQSIYDDVNHPRWQEEQQTLLEEFQRTCELGGYVTDGVSGVVRSESRIADPRKKLEKPKGMKHV